MIAVWYVAPWLAARPRTKALAPLLWVQAFRHVALQIFSAQKFGFAVSDSARDQIVTGDVIGMLLAVAAIVALRYCWRRLATFLIWLLAAETALDLVYTAALGVRERLYASASNLTWLIVSFYVPLLWVSLGRCTLGAMSNSCRRQSRRRSYTDYRPVLAKNASAPL
jgi:hypothetical protein